MRQWLVGKLFALKAVFGGRLSDAATLAESVTNPPTPTLEPTDQDDHF